MAGHDRDAGQEASPKAVLLQPKIMPEAMQDLGQPALRERAGIPRPAEGSGAGLPLQRAACADLVACQRSSFARASLVAGSISCAWRAVFAVSSIT
jgi:hypothetical protein